MSDARVPDDLLTGLEGPARAARAELIEELLTRGFALEELRAAHDEDRLLLLPLLRILREDGTRTVADIAAEAGVDPTDLVTTRRALGLSVDEDAAAYGASLEEHAARLRRATDAGMPVAALVAFNHVIGRATASIAAGSRDALRELLADAPGSERDRAVRVAEVAEALRPSLEAVTAYALGEHLRELLRREAGTSLVLAGHEEDVRHVAVGFADLVGFTALGEQVAPEQLGFVAARLEVAALAALRPGCDLVKTIGDAVMVAGSDVVAVAGSLLALLAAVERDELLGSARAGLAAGPAVGRGGDWYGGVVNLASRLVAAADPGTLCAPATLRDDLAPAGRWVDAGPHVLRGVSAPVAAIAARPQDAAT